MNYIIAVVFWICALLSCEKNYSKISKISKCRDVQKSALNLGLNAMGYYKRNNKWPSNIVDLDGELKRSNSSWSSFSGGSSYWRLETTNDNSLRIIYLGSDADRCQKVFSFEPPSLRK